MAGIPPTEARLLLVEDDPAIFRPLVRALEREGFAVDHLDRGEGAVVRAADGHVDLVLLDLSLPDVDGVDVCRRLRQEWPLLPVVMLTVRREEVDLIVGFDAGAVEVAISDEGPGVDPAVRSQLFEPGASRAGGHGIGLPLARLLLSDEGGSLELVDSLRAAFRIRSARPYLVPPFDVTRFR